MIPKLVTKVFLDLDYRIQKERPTIGQTGNTAKAIVKNLGRGISPSRPQTRNQIAGRVK
jgi:hypothetical protein